MSDIRQDTEKIKKIAWALMSASANGKLDVPGEYTWNIPEKEDFNSIREKIASVYSSGNSIKDYNVVKYIQELDLNKFLLDPWIVQKFEDFFVPWMRKCPRYNLKGLSDFKRVCYSQGSQEYFLNFYLTHRNKRFRVFKGEYWWHMEVWKNMGLEWQYIEDGDLKPDDVVIISCPFARSGKPHSQQDQVLDQCEKMGIHVMLDFIYLFNYTGNDISVNLERSCIKSLSFSFSKTFPVQNAKVAVRLTREKINDPLQISNDENVANRLGGGLGLEVMKRYTADYMVQKYEKEQIHWCKKLGLEKTQVVHFATGVPYTEIGRSSDNRFFSVYNDQFNRYNLGPLFENKALLTRLGLYD